jgi:presenilin-like A22 family membrane protease
MNIAMVIAEPSNLPSLFIFLVLVCGLFVGTTGIIKSNFKEMWIFSIIAGLLTLNVITFCTFALGGIFCYLCPEAKGQEYTK